MALFCGEKLAKEKTKIAKARSLRVNSSNNATALLFMNDIVQKTKKARKGPFFVFMCAIFTADYLALNTVAGFNRLALEAGYQVASRLSTIAVPETISTSLATTCDGRKSTK